MEFTVDTKPDHLTIALSGTFRFDDHDGFKGVLEAIDLFEGGTVFIDLSGATAIDSAGVGMLLLAHERSKKQGKPLSIGHASETVAKVLDVTRIGTLIDVKP